MTVRDRFTDLQASGCRERQARDWKRHFENKEVLTAKVAQVLDGGLSVVVDETRVFIPASLVSDTYEKDLAKYTGSGDRVRYQLSSIRREEESSVTESSLLVAKKARAAERAVRRESKIGDVVEGTVKNVTDFGAFIDLGGADGLLHISEMSWGRVENPKKVFKVGDHCNGISSKISMRTRSH